MPSRLEHLYDENQTARDTCETTANDSGAWHTPRAAEAPKASIVLPAYNEQIALPVVLRSLMELPDFQHEIIVVDDGSTDATYEIARSFPCRIIRQSKNLGKGAAVRAGVAAATSDRIIIMDADNTYPARAIEGVLQLLGESDFVYCVRQYGSGEMPLVNKVGNAFFNRVVKLLVRFEGGDLLSGMYGITRRAFADLDIQATGFDLEVEMRIKVARNGLQQASLPIPYQLRLGKKKLRPLKDGWRILRMAAKLQYKSGPSSRKPRQVPVSSSAGAARSAR